MELVGGLAIMFPKRARYAKILLQNALVLGLEPSGGPSMQCVSSTQFDTHPGGTDVLPSWEPSILHEFKTSFMCIFGSAVLGRRRDAWHILSMFFDAAGHHPPSIYGPTHILAVPGPNTLVDSQLHQMHLMQLT